MGAVLPSTTNVQATLREGEEAGWATLGPGCAGRQCVHTGSHAGVFLCLAMGSAPGPRVREHPALRREEQWPGHAPLSARLARLRLAQGPSPLQTALH